MEIMEKLFLKCIMKKWSFEYTAINNRYRYFKICLGEHTPMPLMAASPYFYFAENKLAATKQDKAAMAGIKPFEAYLLTKRGDTL